MKKHKRWMAAVMVAVFCGLVSGELFAQSRRASPPLRRKEKAKLTITVPADEVSVAAGYEK